jgi:CHASE2 domain-containing sensor protein
MKAHAKAFTATVLSFAILGGICWLLFAYEDALWRVLVFVPPLLLIAIVYIFWLECFRGPETLMTKEMRDRIAKRVQRKAFVR